MTCKSGRRPACRPWCFGGLTGLFLTLLASSWAVAQELPTTPREYERFALEHHRGLWAQRERWIANEREAEAMESRWPQPMFGYDAEIGTPWSRTGVTHMAMVSQTIPWPGVLEAQAEPARRQALVEVARFDALALQIVFDVRAILIEIARIDAVSELVEEQRKLYGEAIRIVESTMGVGRGDYGDVLRLSTASERLSDRLAVLNSQRAQQVAALRELLDVEPGVALVFDFAGEQDPLVSAMEPITLDAVLDQMREHHPGLQALRAQRARTQAQRDAVASRRKPWPTVRLGYGNMPAMGGNGREDIILLGFSIPLPVHTRQYELDEEVFGLQGQAIAEEERALERRFASQIEATMTRIDEASARTTRYTNELIPLAADAANRMLYEMELGRRSATDYLLAIQQQLDLEVGVIELRATMARERARLNLLTGGAFETNTPGAFETLTIQDVGGRR
jgi:outer membrane protein TolC